MQRAEPLQPTEDRRDVVQVNEETGVCHLVESEKGAQEDSDAPVPEKTREEEVLRTGVSLGCGDVYEDARRVS